MTIPSSTYSEGMKPAHIKAIAAFSIVITAVSAVALYLIFNSSGSSDFFHFVSNANIDVSSTVVLGTATFVVFCVSLSALVCKCQKKEESYQEVPDSDEMDDPMRVPSRTASRHLDISETNAERTVNPALQRRNTGTDSDGLGLESQPRAVVIDIATVAESQGLAVPSAPASAKPGAVAAKKETPRPSMGRLIFTIVNSVCDLTVMLWRNYQYHEAGVQVTQQDVEELQGLIRGDIKKGLQSLEKTYAKSQEGLNGLNREQRTEKQTEKQEEFEKLLREEMNIPASWPILLPAQEVVRLIVYAHNCGNDAGAKELYNQLVKHVHGEIGRITGKPLKALAEAAGELFLFKQKIDALKVDSQIASWKSSSASFLKKKYEQLEALLKLVKTLDPNKFESYRLYQETKKEMAQLLTNLKKVIEDGQKANETEINRIRKAGTIQSDVLTQMRDLAGEYDGISFTLKDTIDDLINELRDDREVPENGAPKFSLVNIKICPAVLPQLLPKIIAARIIPFFNLFLRQESNSQMFTKISGFLLSVLSGLVSNEESFSDVARYNARLDLDVQQSKELDPQVVHLYPRRSPLQEKIIKLLSLPGEQHALKQIGGVLSSGQLYDLDNRTVLEKNVSAYRLPNFFIPFQFGFQVPADVPVIGGKKWTALGISTYKILTFGIASSAMNLGINKGFEEQFNQEFGVQTAAQITAEKELLTAGKKLEIEEAAAKKSGKVRVKTAEETALLERYTAAKKLVAEKAAFTKTLDLQKSAIKTVAYTLYFPGAVKRNVAEVLEQASTPLRAALMKPADNVELIISNALVGFAQFLQSSVKGLREKLPERERHPTDILTPQFSSLAAFEAIDSALNFGTPFVKDLSKIVTDYFMSSHALVIESPLFARAEPELQPVLKVFGEKYPISPNDNLLFNNPEWAPALDAIHKSASFGGTDFTMALAEIVRGYLLDAPGKIAKLFPTRMGRISALMRPSPKSEDLKEKEVASIEGDFEDEAPEIERYKEEVDSIMKGLVPPEKEPLPGEDEEAVGEQLDPSAVGEQPDSDDDDTGSDLAVRSERGQEKPWERTLQNGEKVDLRDLADALRGTDSSFGRDTKGDLPISPLAANLEKLRANEKQIQAAKREERAARDSSATDIYYDSDSGSDDGKE